MNLTYVLTKIRILPLIASATARLSSVLPFRAKSGSLVVGVTMELKEGSRAVVAVDLLKTKEGKSKAEIDYQRRLTFLRPQEGSTAEPIDRSTYRIGSKTAADIANVIAVSYAENVADTSADDKNGASS